MQIRVWDDGYSETFEIEEWEDFDAFAKERMEDGDWGDGNYRVEYKWEVTDGDEIVDSGSGFIEHLIAEPPCPDENGQHDWTAQYEGGCTENPGVWSLGGTTMCYTFHCLNCGMKQTNVDYGSQRNPGQCDTVEYSDPDPDWVDAHMNWD